MSQNGERKQPDKILAPLKLRDFHREAEKDAEEVMTCEKKVALQHMEKVKVV